MTRTVEDVAADIFCLLGMNHVRYGNDPPGAWDIVVRVLVKAKDEWAIGTVSSEDEIVTPYRDGYRVEWVNNDGSRSTAKMYTAPWWQRSLWVQRYLRFMDLLTKRMGRNA